MGTRNSTSHSASHMSQPVQGWHPNPQLMQQQAAPQIPPPGWSGSWPPAGGIPPGYPGPPPMPHGAPPFWNTGYWQYNPHMQHAQQPWAPGMAWGAPVGNPYKRVPRPPSPSYWQTKLSDNGLGLEGMVKKKCVGLMIDASLYTCSFTAL